MDFESKILDFIKKNKLIHFGDRLLIGFSGGADSMSLIQVLVNRRRQLGIRLHAAHFNHRCRPGASRDERFVRQWCLRLDVPLTVGRRDTRKISPLSEEEARQMRFKFFIKLAGDLKADAVALAHTKDDLAETVLMRLVRGSGLYGLRGILPQRVMEKTAFIRPLMGVTRRDIEAYLKSKRIPFCIDPTNRQTHYLRNKIRLKLLPLLAREYNPQIAHILATLSFSVSEDYEYLFGHAQKAFEKNVMVSSKKAKIPLLHLSVMHPAIRRLVIRQMVESLKVDPSALAFEQIGLIEDCLKPKSTSPVVLSYHLRAKKTRKYLELSRA